MNKALNKIQHKYKNKNNHSHNKITIKHNIHNKASSHLAINHPKLYKNSLHFHNKTMKNKKNND